MYGWIEWLDRYRGISGSRSRGCNICHLNAFEIVGLHEVQWYNGCGSTDAV